MMGVSQRCDPSTAWAHLSIVVRPTPGVQWVVRELHVGKVAVMLTSRSRSTEVEPGQGVALPRRVPGASQRDTDAIVAPVAADGTAVDVHDGSAGRDVHDLPATALDVAALPDVSSLLSRLVEERIPMALLIDLVNPSGPGPEVDGAPSDVG